MIYENIKRIATAKKMSIRSIEMRAGLGNGAIGGWKTSSPRIDNLQLVAKELEVSVEELIATE